MTIYELKLTAGAGDVQARAHILRGHIGVSTIELYHDKTPQAGYQLIRTVKLSSQEPQDAWCTVVDAANLPSLDGKVLFWLVDVQEPPGQDEEYEVVIEVRQGGQRQIIVTHNDAYPPTNAVRLATTARVEIV